jgi:hypothetical protein
MTLAVRFILAFTGAFPMMIAVLDHPKFRSIENWDDFIQPPCDGGFLSRTAFSGESEARQAALVSKIQVHGGF